MAADDQAKFRAEDEFNTQRRAGLLGLQYYDTVGVVQKAQLFPSTLTVQEMHKGRIVPLSDGNDEAALIFGITVSTPQQLLNELRDRFNGRVVRFLMISDSGFKEFMQRYDPPKKVVYQDVKIAKEGDNAAIAEVSKTLDSVRSDDILNYLITQADKLGASDIHLENQQGNLRVRLRVDGALHPVATLSRDKYRVLLASIASRGNVSTAATDAQTGHMQQEIRNPDGSTRTLNMRIETVPTIYGQDVVMRLFNFDPRLLKLDYLGLNQQQLKTIQDVVEHPHGMVMVVGPTGSGKSTTLYSMINGLNTTDRKILTLEDPVELAVPGVIQIPVSTESGDSFADKLRAVLRLDPDIIMVGEIRDIDTAKTAIQASITGHLVLSTFHASTAATAFSRIIDMIGQNPIFSTAIRLVIGQRLVRKLDEKTRVAYKPDEATKKYINEVLSDLPKNVAKPDVDNLTLYKPGSSAENPFGYRGRLVIMEQMAITDKVQAYLRGDVADVDSVMIEKTAKAQGMVTMLQDGVLKACAGVTTLEEINRVI
ncbi:MAG TPA: GspE/PulE family protein [Candidatus Saccharimonadales bacterium]|nr:GspE/PulE family protein [Candidatus Saccharimonadales bacterium]